MPGAIRARDPGRLVRVGNGKQHLALLSEQLERAGRFQRPGIRTEDTGNAVDLLNIRRRSRHHPISAGWHKGPRRKLKLHVGIFGAEPWSETMRGEIESKLNLSAIDIYGLSEIMGPGVAIECREAKQGLHVGLGYDLHRVVEGRRLILGGVEIPFDRGLLGHSDADVLCHAITDAILGACGQGDIGRHFPDDDERWRGASSIELLRRAVCLARDHGFAVHNVDAVVVAERPKLVPHIPAITERLAEVLQLHAEDVSVKGKTAEGLGEIGRGEAIACHAVALLRSI